MISEPVDRRALSVGTLVVMVPTGAAVALGQIGYLTPNRFVYLAAALIGLGMAIIVWYTDPAYTLAGALCLTAGSGHWDLLGLPNLIAPDRFALILVTITVLARGPGARRRPDIVLRAADAWLIAATLFVMISAAVAGTLIDDVGTFRLLDRFGLLPFTAYVLAPVVYRTHRHRAVLIATFVGFGAYLSLTALFQTLGIDALVFPKYILDPSLVTHFVVREGPSSRPPSTASRCTRAR